MSQLVILLAICNFIIYMHVTVLRDNNNYYYCNNLIIENYTKVIFIFKGLVAQETEVVRQHEHHVLIG